MAVFYLYLVVFLCKAEPEAFVVQPLPRSNALTKSPPCGGTPKGKSHLLSEPGSFNPISWQIVGPSIGKCSVRLSYGTDVSNYHTLIPTDNSTDVNGWFPCGDESGLHSKIFYFPKGSSCDVCTLQWIWDTLSITYYQCIDIEIIEGVDSACYGKCKNGGYCSEGLCVCTQDWAGIYCEADARVLPVNIVGLFLTLICLLIIVGILLFAIKNRSKSKKTLETEKIIYYRCCGWLTSD